MLFDCHILNEKREGGRSIYDDFYLKKKIIISVLHKPFYLLNFIDIQGSFIKLFM